MKKIGFAHLIATTVWLQGSALAIRLRDDKVASSDKTRNLSTEPYKGPLPTEGATKHIGMKSGQPSRYDGIYTDPLWDNQWALHDYRTVAGPVMDHNVVPVHRMNITGYGVNVAILADGVEHTHPDLFRRVIEEVKAADDNSIGRENLEEGRGINFYNVAGTQVAGVVAMVPNNTQCGVGIAYNAEITSIMIGRRVGVSGLARAFVYNSYFYLNDIDIYSNAWAKKDTGDGLQLDFPSLLDSIEYGASEGRRRKGAIYVTDVGNGKGHAYDNCAADAMVNSIYMIAIAGASQRGKATWYSERCPGVFATAYSGDREDTGGKATGESDAEYAANWEEGIVSTDVEGRCSKSFEGTAAASAIATGIIALVLEANPSLTLRDVHHLITMSAEVAPLADNPNTWYRNGAGYWVSNDFGFGLLNAENMVRLAQSWVAVPEKTKCHVKFDLKDLSSEESKSYITSQFTNGCQYQRGHWVNFLESVEIMLHIQHHYRGAIALKVTSAMGTETVALEPRPLDTSRRQLKGWRIKSLHNWGEIPFGTWTVTIKLVPIEKSSYTQLIDALIKISKQTVTLGTAGKNKLHGVELVLHGSTDPPAYWCKLPRVYSAFRLEDGQTSQDPPNTIVAKRGCQLKRTKTRFYNSV